MFHFSTVEEALDSLRKGRIILVTDDEDRENEGDFICAAQYATTENVNFMAVHGKGLICMPMSRELCQKLAFPQMVTGSSATNAFRLAKVALRHAHEPGTLPEACIPTDGNRQRR